MHEMGLEGAIRGQRYGHFLPTESKGYADALSDSPGRPYTAPRQRPAMRQRRAVAKTRRTSRGRLAPRGGIEPPTCCLEGSRSIRLSYRGAELG